MYLQLLLNKEAPGLEFQTPLLCVQSDIWTQQQPWIYRGGQRPGANKRIRFTHLYTPSVSASVLQRPACSLLRHCSVQSSIQHLCIWQTHQKTKYTVVYQNVFTGNLALEFRIGKSRILHALSKINSSKLKKQKHARYLMHLQLQPSRFNQSLTQRVDIT